MNSLPKGDSDANHYKNHSQLQYSLAKSPLENYNFIGNESVLDVGCGDGKITAEIASKALKVIGIDKSFAMIDLARKTFNTKAFPNLSFEVIDATQLPFASAFNLVTSFSCIHWIKVQKAALQAIYKVLKPGGIALIITFPRCPTFWDPIDKVVYRAKWINYFQNDLHPYSFYDAKGYGRLLSDLNFEIVKIETTPCIAKFLGKKGFEDYVKGWLPYLAVLPVDLHEEFLDEIGTASLDYAPMKEDGYVHHPYDKIFLHLKKSLET